MKDIKTNDNNEQSSSSKRLELLKSQLQSSTTYFSRQGSTRRTIEDSIWNGFHKKSILERQHHLKSTIRELDLEKVRNGGLEIIRADSMIENCIGIISLPVGLGLNFLINSKKYHVPMAVEEPSVIAAASAVAKLISNHGGFFSTFTINPTMMGQVHIVETNAQETKKLLESLENKLVYTANNFCQKMVQRGGGAKEIRVRILKDGITDGIISLDIFVDVCESMGANLINTICEGVSSYLEELLPSGRIIMKILTNLTVERMVSTEFKVPISAMGYKKLPGDVVCKRILQAYEIACLDKYRATTHNKGIMNGIDAVALALGQDWRAIEAGCHTFASLSYSEKTRDYEVDNYKPISFYKMIEIKGEQYLYGSLTVPMALGVVGGAINSNPIYSNLFKILGNPTTSELAGIMASVGLANNLAAMRALVCTGIQQGHMALHAKNVAIRSGVPDRLLNDVVEFMKSQGSITDEAAKEYLTVSLYDYNINYSLIIYLLKLDLVPLIWYQPVNRIYLISMSS
jgi:degradative hydroxymethylglutaryl-CoA reductase